MLLQGRNSEFSQLVAVHGKTRLADNGRTLAKRRNAVRGRRQVDPKGAAVVARSRVAALDKEMALVLRAAPCCKPLQQR